MKILIMGLPGAGKTTLAEVLARRLGAVHFNADAVRAHINRDLGFSIADRIEQARRMGWLCDRVVEAGGTAIADFVCPTVETRAAFMDGGPAFIVWADRIKAGRYEDTNRLFEPPSDDWSVRVTAEGTPEYWAEKIAGDLCPVFDLERPTALLVGRWQPFHDGHKALVEEGLARAGQVVIGVRTMPQSAANPFSFEDVKQRIETALARHRGRFQVVRLPNISHVLYGRDVGYAVERIDLDAGLQAISATAIRKAMVA